MDQRRQIHQVIGLMQKNLECVICLDFMRNPVSTKCGHQFCGFCLREFLKTKRSVPCPLCKKPITKRSLVDRPQLSEIVDNVRSLVTAVQLDSGHFSPVRGAQLNFLPSTPEELPTRQTRGSKRKEKEQEPVTTPQDGRSKRRKSDTTGLCQNSVTKQQSRRSDTTGQGHQRSDTTGQGQTRSDTTGQGQRKSDYTVQGLLIRNSINEKQAKETRSNMCQNLLEEIKKAEMKSVTPELLSRSTDDVQTVDVSGEKDPSHHGQCPSRMTRSRRKSTDSSRERNSGQNKNSKQDGPDNLLQYLANESCGAMETGLLDQSQSYQKSHGPLFQNAEIHDQSSDDENDVEMMYSNVNEEEDVCEDEDVNEEVPVGQDLISLGKEAKVLKDKLLKARSVTFDGINEKDGIPRSEGDFNNVATFDVGQQDNDDQFTLYADVDTTISRVTGKKESLEFRPKKKLLFRGKQKEDNEEEEETQLSGTSLDHSRHDIFNNPVHNVTRTYGSKQNTKQDKDKMVKKWLKISSVEKVANNNSMHEVQTQREEVTHAATQDNGTVENVTSTCVDDLLTRDLSVNQDELKPVINTRKKIFKTKLDHQSSVATTVQQLKGKFVVRKVSPVRVEQVSEKGKITAETKPGDKLGDSQESDPYEFKTSQRTPKTKKGKKKGLTKKDAKKCRKNPINIKIGGNTAVNKEEVIDLTSQTRSREEPRSKENIEDSLNQCSSRRRKPSKVKSHDILQQRAEDVEKIIADLNQAEEYDFITCTQEATDQITEYENESPHIAEKRTGDKETHDLDEEKERCTEPTIKSLDKIEATQEKMDIEIVKRNNKKSAKSSEKVIAAVQKEVHSESQKHDDSNSVNMIADTCTGNEQIGMETRKGAHSKSTTNSVDMISDTETSTVQHSEAEVDCPGVLPDTELEDFPGGHSNFPLTLVSSRKAIMVGELKIQNDSDVTNYEPIRTSGKRGGKINKKAKEKCSGKNQDVQDNEKSNSLGQVDCQSTEEDMECSSLVSDASCIPNTDDSIVSRRTEKLRNNLKCRKSVTFTDKVQHILVQANSQGHIGRETRGQKSPESETRDHPQGQSERDTSEQRSSGRETRGQRSSGSEPRGLRSKENLIQALPQKRLSSPATGNQQETMADVQEGDCADEQEHSHGNQSRRSQESCNSNVIPDTLEESSSLENRGKSCRVVQAQLHSATGQENTEVKSVADQSQTFDPELEIYTELEMVGDEMPETDVEIIHPCVENTDDTISTQPPSHDLQFDVASDSNVMMTEISSIGKNSRGKHTRKTNRTLRTLQDKSPVVVMETQMSGNTSSDCVTVETQESVSLLVVNDRKETEQPDVVLMDEAKSVTVEKPKIDLTETASLNGKSAMEDDSVQLVPPRNKLKRSSPRMTSQSVSSLAVTSPPSLVDSGVKKRPSRQDDKQRSGVIGAGSQVTCGQDSGTSSGSTVIPATAQASRTSTQIIQICELEDEPPRRGNEKNDVKNMSTEVLASGNDLLLSEVITEEGDSQSSECRRSSRSHSRSLRKSGNTDDFRQQRCKEPQAVLSQCQQGSQGQGHKKGQGQEDVQGINGKEHDKPSEDGIKQKTVQEESKEIATELVCDKLETDQSVDQDDLTPTLKPVEKGHNRRRVTRQTCSPEDIFMMDSETMGCGEASGVVQNQEGLLNMTEFLSLDNSQSQTSQKKDSELRECEDSEHSDMETSQLKSTEYLEEKMGGIQNVKPQKKCVEEQDQVMIAGKSEFESIEEQDKVKMTDKVKNKRSKQKKSEKEKIKRNNDSDPDSDLSQSRPTRETGVRCVRGLATRKRQLESQLSFCHTSATSSKDRDSATGQPTSKHNNSEKNFEEFVESDDCQIEENPTKTKLLQDDEKIDSESRNTIRLKEKFKKTFKKRSSRSSNLSRVMVSSSPDSSPRRNHDVQHGEKVSLVSDEDETEKPDNVDNIEQKSESDIVIPDSFPYSGKTMNDVNSSGQTCNSPTASRKGRGDSLKLSASKRTGDSQKQSASKRSADSLKLSASQRTGDSQKLSASKRSSDSQNRSATNRSADSLKLLTSQRSAGSLELSASKRIADSPKLSASKRIADSPKLSASKQSAEDKLNMSDSLDKSECTTDEMCDGRWRRIVGSRRRRPVIEESDDEMCDASSPLPDVIMNRRQQTSTDKISDPLIGVNLESAVMDSEEEDGSEETDDDDKETDDKEGTAVITESDEDGIKDYSSSEESDSSRRLNLTSSSAFSSQSEAMTTQNRNALEKDLERMKRDIAELEKQLASNPNPNDQVKSQSSSKRTTATVVSDDSDSDLVLEADGNDQYDRSEGDQHNDVVDLATSSPGLRVSQRSKSRECENRSADSDESDELFLSPLPPSPPPTPSQPAKRPPVKLPDHVLQTTEFLNHFRKTGSPGSSNSQDSVRSGSGSKRHKTKHSANMTNETTPSRIKTEDRVTRLSSPCGSTGQLKKEFPSPMFQSSQLVGRGYAGSAVVEEEVDHNKSQHRGFVTTGLTYLQTREIQKLAQQNDNKFYVKFNSSATHVIVKTVPLGRRVCERTLKFFQGVAHQCWVLDYQWVTDSKAAGHLLPEEKYEIVGDTITGNNHYGPRRSRLSCRGLLDGFTFFCFGTSDSLTTENLQDLIKRCGGGVVDHPSAFPPDSKVNLAVTCIDLEDEDDLPSPEDTRSFNKLYKRFRLLTVSREWVLDTLTVYTVQPLKDYVLTTVRDIHIPELVSRSKTS